MHSSKVIKTALKFNVWLIKTFFQAILLAFVGLVLVWLYIDYVFKSNPDPLCTYFWRIEKPKGYQQMCSARGNTALPEWLMTYHLGVHYVIFVVKSVCVPAIAGMFMRLDAHYGAPFSLAAGRVL